MNTSNAAYNASLQLLVIGYGVIHKDNRAVIGKIPLEPLFEIGKTLEVDEADLVNAVSSLADGNYIKLEGGVRLPGASFQLLESSAMRVAEMAPTQNADPKLPFNQFVEAVTKDADICKEYGLNHQRTFMLNAPPFTGLKCDPAGSATASAYGPRSNRWQMPQGMYTRAAPHFGYGAIPPQGSSRASYADEPSPVDAALIKRTTVIKGIEMDADDARLLVFKLERFMNAMQQMADITDKDFQIHVTFKGIEFNLEECIEVLTVLS